MHKCITCPMWVKMVVQHLTGDKRLPKLMITKCPDAYIYESPIFCVLKDYPQTSDIRHILVGNDIDHSDIVEASDVGPAPTTSSFST